MKIYQVSYLTEQAEHVGYEYFTNKVKAKKGQRAWEESFIDPLDRRGEAEIHELKIYLTSAGVIDFLNHHASHPDNG